jgi:hypothetical protein
MGSLRNEIMKNNPEVTAVGVILDWTHSDYKFIALELRLEGDKILLLTMVNYWNLPDREPFKLSRVGNYAFGKIYHFVNKQTNESRVELDTNWNYTLPKLSKGIGIQVNTIGDIIKYYDKINTFVDSLPTVNEYNYQKVVEEGLIEGTIEKNEIYFVTTYPVKIIWDDEYYGTEMKDKIEQMRKPDYENNVIIPPTPSVFY